jgi:hypothetical protein
MLTILLQTAKVAAGCIRTILLGSPKTAADQSITRYLLPRLIAFVTNVENEDPENARALISQALTMFVSSLKGEQKAVGMAAIIPTLLERANKEGEESFAETSTRLLELASADQASFRGVVGGMTEEQKGFMENVITKGRQTAGAKRRDHDDGQGREPTIALRMDFGG